MTPRDLQQLQLLKDGSALSNPTPTVLADNITLLARLVFELVVLLDPNDAALTAAPEPTPAPTPEPTPAPTPEPTPAPTPADQLRAIADKVQSEDADAATQIRAVADQIKPAG